MSPADGSRRRSALTPFDELLTEKQVCERYPLLVGPLELRNARRKGEITFISGKKGAVLYHPDDLAAYLVSKRVRHEPPVGLPPVPRSSKRRDSPEAEQLREQHLLGRILGKRSDTASAPGSTSAEAERFLDQHLDQKYSIGRKAKEHDEEVARLLEERFERKILSENRRERGKADDA